MAGEDGLHRVAILPPRMADSTEAEMATTNVVNLDALIPREDMGTATETVGSKQDKIDIHHLSQNNFFVGALRKPDFQRETARWTPDKVVDLVRAFVDGDLIPAVILWQRGSNVFVIDGAHRLSALIAWVNDDYGDNTLSLGYFGGRIPDEQLTIAEKTRKLMNSQIGPYAHYASKSAPLNMAYNDMQRRIGNLATTAIVAQWVNAVNEKAAEDSFFKINQAATPIDPTERRILKSRDAPNAIAARAIVRGGTGHKYWKDYAPTAQAAIETLSKDINAALYDPPMEEPIKTLDLPVAGHGYNALAFVFDLVNWANDVPEKASRSRDLVLPKDEDGSITIRYLEKVRNIVRLMTGQHPSSLGVHPVVYFYTRGGEFQPTAFLATAQLLKELAASNGLKRFTKARETFEDFLVAHKEFITLITKHTGGGQKSLNRMVRYLRFVLDRVRESKEDSEIVKTLHESEEFGFLYSDRPTARRLDAGRSGKFSQRTKSASFLDTALASAIRCALCGAPVHRNSMQVDHITPRHKGGGADAGNAQITHPFCNSSKGTN